MKKRGKPPKKKKRKSFTGLILFIQMPWGLKREFPKFVVASEAPEIKQLRQHGFSTQQTNQDKDLREKRKKKTKKKPKIQKIF